MKKHTYEKPVRSFIKSITFIIVVLISDYTVVSIITGKVAEAFSIIVFTNIASTTLYYIHERVWNRITWRKGHKKNKDGYHEHFSRSLVKAITYRFFTIISDLLVTSIITANVRSAFGIIIFTNLFSTVLYYFHERAWSGVKLGRVANKEKYEDLLVR